MILQTCNVFLSIIFNRAAEKSSLAPIVLCVKKTLGDSSHLYVLLFNHLVYGMIKGVHFCLAEFI